MNNGEHGGRRCGERDARYGPGSERIGVGVSCSFLKRVLGGGANVGVVEGLMLELGQGLEDAGFGGLLFGVYVATVCAYEELELGARIFGGGS